MRRYLYWVPVVLWMVVIFSFSARQRVSVSEDTSVNFLFFKTLHLLEYAVLYFFTYRALLFSKIGEQKNIGFNAFFLVLLYAMSDELHQTFIPTREGHIRDVIIDAIGACIAWIVIKQCIPVLPKKLKSSLRKWQII